MATTQAHVGETGRAILRLVDAAGQPTTRVENIQWTNSNDAVATIDASDTTDPLDAKFTVVGLGTTTIGCSVDTKIGEEVNVLSFAGDIEAVEGEPVSGTFVLEMDPVF